jgi:hypothetical protein
MGSIEVVSLTKRPSPCSLPVTASRWWLWCGLSTGQVRSADVDGLSDPFGLRA